MKITSLKTDNQNAPVSVEKAAPVFSWQIKTDEYNWKQSAYKISVWKCTDRYFTNNDQNAVEKVWDSGEVKSDKMTQIKYGGEKLDSDTRYIWKVWVLAEKSQDYVESQATYFETGIDEEDWKGCCIGENKDGEYHLYRTVFDCEKKISRAKLYVLGLGQHVVYINGKQADDRVLEPGWSDYRKTCFYSVYDVSEKVHEGRNALGFKLGNGMYNVFETGRYVYFPRTFGKMKLRVQLNILYEDGSRAQVVTDEKNWKMAESPISYCCIYGGEDYDSRKEHKGFSKPDYTEGEDWSAVCRVEKPQGTVMASKLPSLKCMKEYKAASVRELEPGVYLYDFGTNFSGWVRLSAATDGRHSGEKIVIKPAEILYDNGHIDQRVTGNGYAWTYTMNEAKHQVFAPDFTYTGFRYVQVTGGVPEELASDSDSVKISLTGEFIYPEMEPAGEFSCSNQLFNKIHHIVLQAMLSNTKSYFTDCPHREKFPWLEQTHLIGPALMMNYDFQNMYEKIEKDMFDSQRENGLVADICPEYVSGFDKWHKGFVDSPEWGSACIINPWYVFKRYGNTSILEKSYDNAKKYLDYLTSKTHHHVLHHGLGDWLDIGPCTPYSQNTPVPVIATCIYYYDISIMQKAAEFLGKKEEADKFKELGEKVFEEYNLQFLDDQTGRYANGSQAAQAMSLAVGLVPEQYKDKAIKMLRDDIEKRGYTITAGDVGHPFLNAALTENGMSDIVNKMTNITDKPGYGYQVVNGATTLTEEWDGPDPKHPHGSQNHFMLGSIDEWFYCGLAGIPGVRSKYQFDEVEVKPYFAPDINECSAWIMHPYGKLSVSWKRAAGRLALKVIIPPGVKAHIVKWDGTEEITGSGTWEYEEKDCMYEI